MSRSPLLGVLVRRDEMDKLTGRVARHFSKGMKADETPAQYAKEVAEEAVSLFVAAHGGAVVCADGSVYGSAAATPPLGEDVAQAAAFQRRIADEVEKVFAEVPAVSAARLRQNADLLESLARQGAPPKGAVAVRKGPPDGLDTAGDLECVAVDGKVYPARLLTDDLRSSSQEEWPLVCAVDVGAREEVVLFSRAGVGANPEVKLRNRGGTGSS